MGTLWSTGCREIAAAAQRSSWVNALWVSQLFFGHCCPAPDNHEPLASSGEPEAKTSFILFSITCCNSARLRPRLA